MFAARGLMMDRAGMSAKGRLLDLLSANMRHGRGGWLAPARLPYLSQGRERQVESRIGRSLIWQLAQITPMLEAEALERIEARLEQLGGAPASPPESRRVADVGRISDMCNCCRGAPHDPPSR